MMKRTVRQKNSMGRTSFINTKGMTFNSTEGTKSRSLKRFLRLKKRSILSQQVRVLKNESTEKLMVVLNSKNTKFNKAIKKILKSRK